MRCGPRLIHQTDIGQADTQCQPEYRRKSKLILIGLLVTLLIMPVAHAVVPEDPAKWTKQFGDLVACASGAVPHGDGNLWRLAPQGNALGEFSVRCFRQAYPIFVQAPHGITDLKTDDIARRLFSIGQFAALAINGVSRNSGDQAHVHNASFQLSAAEFVNQTNGVVVQLHGFSQSKRQDPNARDASVIVSNGTNESSAHTRRVAACLGNTFPRVLVYPDDTRELGGTTNTVGKHLRTLGRDNFLHIELSYETRQGLARDESRISELARCLAPVALVPMPPASTA